MPAVASSAPAVLIAHLANATDVPCASVSGGVMLPNHSPLVVAEQFGTLEALHPGRIDLGLGRAPGTDGATARALRRSGDLGADGFPDDVVELVSYLAQHDGPPDPSRRRPGPRLPARGVAPRVLGLQRPAGRPVGPPLLLRLPLQPPAPRCRTGRLPLQLPTVLPAPPTPRPWSPSRCVCAPTTAEARWLAGSSALGLLQLRSGRLGPLPSPEEAAAYPFTAAETATVEETLSTHLIGDPGTVREGLVALQRRTEADEIDALDQDTLVCGRIRSLTLVAQAWGLAPPRRAG